MLRHIRPFVLIFFTLFLLFFISCDRIKKQKSESEPGDSLTERTIEVVTTTTMITDLLKNIGGDRLNVQGLMGPGVDPHLYKASEGDVSKMAKADVIFYNGLHLEGKMAEVFEHMEQQVKTYAVSEGVDRANLLSPPEFEGSHDPHVWFDVSLWIQVAEYTRDILIEIDAEHKDIYEKNAKGYIEKLEELDLFVRQEVEKVPEGKRVLITAHDAFNYFGQSYGFDVRGLQGISTASEAGTADVKNLAEFIVEKRIPAIFVETSVPERYIEALREAVRARDFEVVIGGSLFSDALGSPGTTEGNYIGMVLHNINTIVSSLIQ